MLSSMLLTFWKEIHRMSFAALLVLSGKTDILERHAYQVILSFLISRRSTTKFHHTEMQLACPAIPHSVPFSLARPHQIRL